VWVSVPASRLADLNGDGKIDIATAKLGRQLPYRGVSVPWGTVTGPSSTETIWRRWNPISITAADLNDDGMIDLVTANYGSPTVSRSLQRRCTFGTQVSFENRGLPWIHRRHRAKRRWKSRPC